MFIAMLQQENNGGTEWVDYMYYFSQKYYIENVHNWTLSTSKKNTTLFHFHLVSGHCIIIMLLGLKEVSIACDAMQKY